MFTPEPEQGTGKLKEAEVVLGLFLVAHRGCSALGQPRQRALHHPPSGRVALLASSIQLPLSDTSDVG